MAERDGFCGRIEENPKGARLMSTSTQSQGVVQSDPVYATFDTLFLAGLRHFEQRFEGTFPDRRLFKVFGQPLKGLIATGCTYHRPHRGSGDPKR